MQITVLIQVINYLKELSGDTNLLTRYNSLTEVVIEASKNPKEDFSAEILKEKNALQNFLIETDPMEWGYASYSLFESINADRLFGKPAADHLENLITSENLDYKAIYSDLSQRIILISTFSDNLNKFQQLFDLIVPSRLFQQAEKNENRSSLLMYFEGHLAVQNIADLERYTRLWDGILGTFSKLTGEDTLTLDISNFSNGNIILEVAIENKTLTAIMTGVAGILSSLPDILKIRKIQLELALLHLNNDLNELLEEEIQTIINNTSYTTAQELITHYYNETVNADGIVIDVSLSLKQILSFVEKSGKIESKPNLLTHEGNVINKKIIESLSIVHELERLTTLLAVTLENQEALMAENELLETVA